MPTRKASATWQGGLKGGNGSYTGQTGKLGGSYSFGSRFENQPGSNPEELLGAAEAACFSMALSGALERNGATVSQVTTDAAVTVEKVGDGFRITKIALDTRVQASGVDDRRFQELAQATKTGCPVSQALQAVPIELKARLEQ